MREPKSRALPLGHAPPTNGVSVTARPPGSPRAAPARLEGWASGVRNRVGVKAAGLEENCVSGKSGAQNSGRSETASNAVRMHSGVRGSGPGRGVARVDHARFRLRRSSGARTAGPLGRRVSAGVLLFVRIVARARVRGGVRKLSLVLRHH